jgi:SAM-dependent methyltransferase
LTKAFGLGRGKIFQAKRAGLLLNPVRRLIQSPTRTVKRMALTQTDRVLEIGCGPGYFSRAIATAVPQGSLVLFDLQHAMLEIARRRLPEFANIHSTQGDASSLMIRRRIASGEVQGPMILTVGDPFYPKGGTPVH